AFFVGVGCCQSGSPSGMPCRETCSLKVLSDIEESRHGRPTSPSLWQDYGVVRFFDLSIAALTPLASRIFLICSFCFGLRWRTRTLLFSGRAERRPLQPILRRHSPVLMPTITHSP